MITDLVGNIVYEKKIPTKNQFEELVQIVEESLEAAGIKREMIFGMGIGVPGTVDSDGTVVRAKALSWNQFPLQSLMNEYFSFPVYVGNDVNLAALGERWIGSGEQTDDMLFIALGTGIGGALVCGGQLVLGAQGRAGELGYYLESSDVEKGEINKLGQQGILEKKCSGSALDQIVGSAEALFTAYSRGDASVIPVIDKFVRDFSVAIANTISLLNPEKVVIGGGVSDSMGSVIQRIREEVGRLTPIQADICLANKSFVPPISMPIQYADFGLNPNIVDGRPTPDGDIQSPYSTRSFFLINSSTIALTVVLLKFNAFDICARLIGCFSLTIFRINVRLIFRINSKCPKFPFFSILHPLLT